MISIGDLHPIIGGNGGDWSFFDQNKEMIGKFIHAYQISPTLIVGQTAIERAPIEKAWKDLGIRGGIKVPHLHFEDKIYLLDKQQWEKFSGGIIADSKAKLAHMKEINFEESMLLAGVTHTLSKA